MVNQKKDLNITLEKLRRLSQPFFLPLDQNTGWQFIWLLISLLFLLILDNKIIVLQKNVGSVYIEKVMIMNGQLQRVIRMHFVKQL